MRKHPFLLALCVPSDEERGETDVFAGYSQSCIVRFKTLDFASSFINLIVQKKINNAPA